MAYDESSKINKNLLELVRIGYPDTAGAHTIYGLCSQQFGHFSQQLYIPYVLTNVLVSRNM